MRSILIVNAKGGSGKTTISTNIASYYAGRGRKTVLADYDVQQSSLDWLAVRPQWREPIIGVAASVGVPDVPPDTEVLVMDSPARVEGRHLAELVRRADLMLVPVMPSPFDMRTAANFIADLIMLARTSGTEQRIAVVANRVNQNTVTYLNLQKFLRSLKIPFVTSLRDTQNYIRAAENGIGIFELAPPMVEKDLEQWRPLTRWLNEKLRMVEEEKRGEATARTQSTWGDSRV